MKEAILWRGLLVLLLCSGIAQSAFADTRMPQGAPGDTLVVVKRIIGTDRAGNDAVLYQERSGRIYRLDNIEQAARDLSTRGIREKGGYSKLRAVLDDTVYHMDANRIPKPMQLNDLKIPKVVELKVDSLLVKKENVIAIYYNSCDIKRH